MAGAEILTQTYRLSLVYEGPLGYSRTLEVLNAGGQGDRSDIEVSPKCSQRRKLADAVWPALVLASSRK